MKKVVSFIICLFLVFLTGCQKEVKATDYVAVLDQASSDSGLVVFLDENMKVIKEIKCVYPNTVNAYQSYIYISSDNIHYQSFDFVKQEKMDDIVASGQLVGYKDGVSVIVGNDSVCFIKNEKELACNYNEVNGFYLDDKYFYRVDRSSYISTYEIKTGDFVTNTTIRGGSIIGFTEIESNTYVVNNEGLTLLEDGKASMTYLYPVVIDEIISVRGNHLYCYLNDELVVYKMSFNKYQLVLTDELEEKYYQDTNLDKLFKSYLDKGYDIVYFQAID